MTGEAIVVVDCAVCGDPYDFLSGQAPVVPGVWCCDTCLDLSKVRG